MTEWRSGNPLVARVSFLIRDDLYYTFRRWLRSRDPVARLRCRPGPDGTMWVLSISTSKCYLATLARRRWASIPTPSSRPRGKRS